MVRRIQRITLKAVKSCRIKLHRFWIISKNSQVTKQTKILKIFPFNRKREPRLESKLLKSIKMAGLIYAFNLQKLSYPLIGITFGVTSIWKKVVQMRSNKRRKAWRTFYMWHLSKIQKNYRRDTSFQIWLASPMRVSSLNSILVILSLSRKELSRTRFALKCLNRTLPRPNTNTIPNLSYHNLVQVVFWRKFLQKLQKKSFIWFIQRLCQNRPSLRQNMNIYKV